MPANTLYQPPTVDNAVYQAFGMQPNMDRLNLLPRYDKKVGWVAPNALYQLARAFMTPSVGFRGGEVTPEDALNFGMSVMGTSAGVSRAVPKAVPKGPVAGMNVYHGSPHNFDAFDMSKIGTGEGAQAYGHGLYVAESPDVAGSYATRLTHTTGEEATIGGKKLSELYNHFYDRANRAPQAQAGGLYERAGVLEDLMLHKTPQEVLKNAAENGYSKETLDWISRDVIPNYKRLGNLYHVDLPDSAISNMLDWDKPLSQQPEAVQTALKADPGFASMLRSYNKKATAAGVAADPSGANIYSWLMSRDMAGSAAGASTRLNAIGIPGIKYLDGGSRSAGSGTRNYVVFDDKLLKILKKE